MQKTGDIHAHFLRVVKMSQACDVSLSTALDEGQITAEAYGDMVTGCRGCTEVGSCDKLLGTMPRLPEAPDYCVNRETFAHLRGLQAK
ncbi:DUF6455 family protein [Yoonia sp.]|uniref:DUF6455 family protein n=1 Tax=Yoonia sp. TaxID=2212373 RepID=UPI00391A08BC